MGASTKPTFLCPKSLGISGDYKYSTHIIYETLVVKEKMYILKSYNPINHPALNVNNIIHTKRATYLFAKLHANRGTR
jgi:hypothetical protein